MALYFIRPLVVDRLRRMRPSLGCHEPHRLTGELTNANATQMRGAEDRPHDRSAGRCFEGRVGALEDIDGSRLYLPGRVDHELNGDSPLNSNRGQCCRVLWHRLGQHDRWLKPGKVGGSLVDRIHRHWTGASNDTISYATLGTATGKVPRIERPLVQIHRRNHLGDVT